MTMIQQVISQLTSPAVEQNTVDTLKFGNEDAEVTGIATTFMPTYRVIEQAIAENCNLIIAHEAPFYHHRDETQLVAADPVYLNKKRLIEESGIAIFRSHDYMHRHHVDLIVQGLLNALEWQDYVEAQDMHGVLPIHVSPLTIPRIPLRNLIDDVKMKLEVPFVRVVGDLSMPCSRVGLLPGYCGGGGVVIPYFQHADLDVVIVGEGPEWETPEYVRDAVAQGMAKALIILGHAESEALGMKHLANILQAQFPQISVKYLANEPVFQLG